MTEESRNNKVVVISGPSGVGKSTICREVVHRLQNVYLSVSTTTRPQKTGEVEGKDYFFISKEEFEQKIEDGMLLEYAEVFGNYYGTPKDKVDEALAEGKTIILEIDVQGGKQAKEAYPDAELIFIMPPTDKALATRLNGRGREQAEEAKLRLSYANAEIASALGTYEHMVINDNLEQAINEVVSIIKSS